MINTKDLPVASIALSELKDKKGKFKYDESSEQFGMSTTVQYDILKNDIEVHGQEKPIYIWRKRICDGRNRCKALNELGIDTVEVQELPHKCTLEERIELAKRGELTHRHSTPTQFACIAVKEYFRLKKCGKKVTAASVLKTNPSTPTNFGYAKYISEKHPTIFERLFDGESIVLTNPKRPTSSLAAIVNFYKEIEKTNDVLREQQAIDEELAIEQLDKENEGKEKDIDYNGKKKIYQSIDVFFDKLIETFDVTAKEYIAYKYQQIKNKEDVEAIHT